MIDLDLAEIAKTLSDKQIETLLVELCCLERIEVDEEQTLIMLPECEDCNGSGEQSTDEIDPSDRRDYQCPTCYGEGKRPKYLEGDYLN